MGAPLLGRAPFMRTISFWPTIGIDGSYIHNATSNSTAALEVFAPFLYHAAPHLFLGAGPFLSYLVKGGPDTQYGLDFVIGGWLYGAAWLSLLATIATPMRRPRPRPQEPAPAELPVS